MNKPQDSHLGPVARRLAATQRVLCIEDEPDVAAFLRAYFRASGYDLVHIDPADTEEIIRALHEHQPDLVLLDVRLRGFSGMEAYREMRSDDRWAFTPVVVVSAHAGSDPTFEPPKGIDAFMAKPFNTNVLADLVRERIEAAQQLAAVGRTEVLQFFTKDYLEARMNDEIAAAGASGSLAFGLVTLRRMDEVLAEVGEEGLDHLVASLVDKARASLPTNVIVGLNSESEVALLFPGHDAATVSVALEDTLRSLAGIFTFAGGATVPVDFAAGLADVPTHATDPDGLFMAADAALADAIDGKTRLVVAL